MTDHEYLDFVTVWGEQFARVMLEDAGARAAPQDAYAAWPPGEDRAS